MRHPHVYDMLKRTGHSPAQALLIILDARRGSRYALWWISVCRHAGA